MKKTIIFFVTWLFLLSAIGAGEIRVSKELFFLAGQIEITRVEKGKKMLTGDKLEALKKLLGRRLTSGMWASVSSSDHDASVPLIYLKLFTGNGDMGKEPLQFAELMIHPDMVIGGEKGWLELRQELDALVGSNWERLE